MPKTFEIFVPVAFTVTVDDERLAEYPEQWVDLEHVIDAVEEAVLERLSVSDGGKPGFGVSMSTQSHQRWYSLERNNRKNQPLSSDRECVEIGVRNLMSNPNRPHSIFLTTRPSGAPMGPICATREAAEGLRQHESHGVREYRSVSE